MKLNVEEVISIIEQEDEYPGNPPEHVKELLRSILATTGGTEAMIKVMRLAVRSTKSNIIKKIRMAESQES